MIIEFEFSSCWMMVRLVYLVSCTSKIGVKALTRNMVVLMVMLKFLIF